jgi:serine phosphatase RsbU (regulator of sigma subunit)
LARSKDELFNIIASNTIQLLDCDIVGIGLLNINTGSMSINLTSVDSNSTEKKDVYEVSLDNEFFRAPISTGASKYITNYQAPDETMAMLIGNQSSVIIVPLKGREATTGVIWVSRKLNGAEFGGYDLLLLESISGQSAIAIDNISLYDQQQFISDSLQRGFMTQILPDLTKTDIGTYYASATTAAVVGGDFYDAVSLPSNQMALFVGDVSGKGVIATSDAAMAKYSLRALASVNPDPKFVLAGLNNVALQLLIEDRFITLVYSLYDTSSGSMTIGLAGHPYPLLYSAATNSVKTITEENPAIAIVSKPEIVTNTINLETDDILVLYTDGIIELRREGEFFGIDRLGRIIAEYAHQDAQSVADEIIDYAKAFSEGNLTDDIVLMVIKRTT